jgi:ubiquinone/menaquinone biosynthesis C-methylase UbiE
VSDGGRYSGEPADKLAFSERFDRLYSRTARAYDLAVKLLPLWRGWLRSALPHLQGPRVLEVSFGTGWLLTRYAGRFEAQGVELNEAMLEIAQRNLRRKGLAAELQSGSVEALTYDDASFDTVLNTMAFSGYPDAKAAMAELRRVLKPGGRLVMIDINYPHDGNRLGTALVGLWRRRGDLIRDMQAIFRDFDLDATDEEVGGFGSVHLYLATKRDASEAHSRL